jgi:hypothetical protein
MKKALIIGLLIFVLILGACTGITGNDGTTAKDTELSQTVDTPDGAFSLTLPEGWSANSLRTASEMDDLDMVLSYSDGDITYVDLYFFDSTEYDYTLDDALDYNLEYFGDNLIGDYEEMRLDGMDAIFFETSMKDIGIDGEEYNYHGYYYMIETPSGIAEIDVYYVQQVLESKIIKPSDDQLLFLQDIAESFEVN